MATVVVTLRIMPESPDADLGAVEAASLSAISSFGGSFAKREVEPVAFGLNALIIMFTMPEERGGTEELEKSLALIHGVSSVQVTDVRRTVG